MSTQINWTIPPSIAGQANYDQIQIYRSTSEANPYFLIATVPSGIANCPPAFITSYVDSSAENGRDKFYTIKFFDSVANQASGYNPAFLDLTPKEARLVYLLREMLGTVLTADPNTGKQFTDQELLVGLNFALGAFNIYPPVTCFTIENFPCCGYEAMLMYLAQLFTLMNKYLGLSINDFSYSDNGLSLNIDRGAKINQALTNVQKIVNDLLALIKLEFAFQGESVGTMQLPVGIGGVMSRGVSNILDIFNSMGR